MRALPPIILLAACSGACSGEASDHAHHGGGVESLSTEVTEGRTTARVMSLGPNGDFLTLDHDDMPGVMGPMRMGFDVEDGVDVSALEVGDDIIFDMEMSDARGVVLTAFCIPARDGDDCLN